MSEFHYKGRTPGGELRYGEVEASSVSAAAEVLRKRGLLVIELTEEKYNVATREITWFERVGAKELIFVSRQLATMIRAQISLVKALQVLARQSRKKKLRDLLETVARDVDGGVRLSVAFSQFPDVFDRFYVSVIQAGESSGNLDDSFDYLATHYSRHYDLRTKIANALYYPAFIAVAFVAVAILMLIYVVPQLKAVFESAGQELPLATRVLLGSADAVRSWWWLMIAILALLIVGSRFYLHSGAGQRRADSIILSLPRVGAFIKKVKAVRFSTNLLTLLKGGIPILEALRIASSVVNNTVYSDALADVIKRVEAGDSLSHALSKYEIFPPVVVQMIEVGERSGKLVEVLEQVAQFYEREVDNEVAAMSTLIEPVIMAVLGVGVGFLMMAVIGPIYGLAGAL